MSALGKWNKIQRLSDGTISGTNALVPRKTDPMLTVFIGVLTVSDRCSTGEKEDLSGPNLQQLLQGSNLFRTVIKVYKVVPDEADEIVETLKNWSDTLGIDLIFTTGGTGFSPRDVTPEATNAVIERETPGFTIAIITAALKITSDGMVTRLKCGIRGKTLIINLPGSKKGSEECCKVCLPAIPHALECLKNEKQRVCECSVNDVDKTLIKIKSPAFQMPKILAQVAASPKPSLDSHSVSSSHSNRDHSQTSHGISGHHDTHSVSAHDNHQAQLIPVAVSEDELYSADIDLESILSSSAIDSSITASGGSRTSSTLNVSPGFPTISVDQAFSLALEKSFVLGSEEVSITDAFSRILAEDLKVQRTTNLGSHCLSEGYAVNGTVAMGDIRNISLDRDLSFNQQGTIKVFAGAPLPVGANTIVPTEVVEQIDENKIEILEHVPVGQNVQSASSNIGSEIVYVKGAKLGPADIGTLASFGVTRCSVFRNPVIGVISVGSKEDEEPNHVTLLLTLRQQSFVAIDFGYVSDNADKIALLLSEITRKADVIISTSTQTKGQEIVRGVLQKNFKATVHFGSISMKPWKFNKSSLPYVLPSYNSQKKTYFATAKIDNSLKTFFLLPDNPVSNILSNIFVVPVLRKLSGVEDPRHTILKAKLVYSLQLSAVPEYQQCRVSWRPRDNMPWVETITLQSSGQSPYIYDANALVMMPASTQQRTALKRADLVDIILLSRV